MSKECFIIPGAPPAAGPYSHAVKTGNLLFVSGQTPMNAEGKLIEGDFQEHVRQCFRNVKTILEGSGSSLEQVVKMTGFLTTMDDFAAFNAVYKEFIAGDFPARSCVAVAQLPMNVRVEIEAIATVD